MSEILQEYVDSGSQTLRVDRSAGVIRGVKLLGLRSRNGRRYLESALAEAVALYEGAKVNVNHPKGHPLSPRDYQDRLGVIAGVHLRTGEGIFGDLQFNPKHALAEQLMWDAEHAAHNVGLSHNVLARTSRQGEETVVEAITKVQSIDLVADPATTRGLFEQQERSSPESDAQHSTAAIPWDSLTLEQLALHRPDLLAEMRQAHEVELAEARNRLDEVAAREALVERRARVVALLQEHELPLPEGRSDADRQIVSDRFLETLMTAPDDSLRRLVEERAALIHAASRWGTAHRRNANRPVSRDRLAAASTHVGIGHPTAKEFAAAIGGR
jgi:hypothetical protein